MNTSYHTINDKRTGKISYTLIIAIYIMFFLLAFLFIPTHDDYYLPLGNSFSASLNNMTFVGNGRFLGNFLGNFLSLRHLPNTLVKSVVFISLVLNISYIVDNCSNLSISISAVLIMLPAVSIFREAYVWSMGFYNYTFPLALFLTNITIIKKISRNDNRLRFVIDIILISLFSLAQMLFSENESIIFMIVSVGLLVSYIKKNGKNVDEVGYSLIACFVFSIIGILIMFFLPSLLGIYGKMDNYRSLLLPISPISYYLILLMGQYSTIQSVLLDCYLFWILLFLVLVFRSKQINNTSHLLLHSITGVVIYILLLLVKDHIIPIAKWNVVNFIVTIVATLFEIALLVSYNRLFDRQKMKLVNISFIIAVLSCAELILVSPIGPRCLAITYIFLCISLGVLFIETFKEYNKATNYLFGLLFVVFISLFFELLPLYKADKVREQYIADQMNADKKEIEVVLVPKSNLVYATESLYGYRYVYYYSMPGDISFSSICYDDYLNKN